MACFTVPLAEALAISLAKHFYLKRISNLHKEESFDSKISFVKEKVSVLQKMLFGGSFLLAIEHIYHGEVIFAPPFITAMKSLSQTKEMLFEMATSGVAMALLTTSVWALGTGLSHLIKKHSKKKSSFLQKTFA